MFKSPSGMGEKKLFVLAGEASGDLHASEVVRELLDRCPGVKVFGAGGKKLKEAGAELLYDVDDMSVMGFVEVVGRALFLRKVLRDLERLVSSERPDAALLVDYPGMNLVIAGFLRRKGVPVVYYISPKVWAWKEGRVRKIRQFVDRLLVIFDFETAFFRKHGIEAQFVGNPVVEEVEKLDLPPLGEFLHRSGIEPGRRIVGLLPGSRRQEISALYPEMLGAARLLGEKYNPVFLLGRADHVDPVLYESCGRREGITLVGCSAYEVMRYSDLALVTSGTATLEALCFGLPMIVVYRTGRLNYALARRIVRLRNISLANLVAKGLDSPGRVVPELLQAEASAGRMFAEASRLLDEPGALDAMSRELLEARARLSALSPSGEVASVLEGYFADRTLRAEMSTQST